MSEASAEEGRREGGVSPRSLSSPGARGASGRVAPSAPSPAAEASLENTPPSRLTAAFPREGAALVTYLMAGYPDRATSLRSLLAAARAGADVIELGVPYGDPLADGPVIAEAARVARSQEGGFGLAESIELAAEFRAACTGGSCPPLVVMTYLNPLMRFGLPRAAAEMRDAGVSGVIVPDMPPESARPWLTVADGLDTVFLVAPTSTPDRIATVARASSGFVYCVSTTGITGERSELDAGLADLVASVRVASSLPVAVGFGVGTPEQAATVARIADGVIVGSAIVRRQCDPADVEEFVAELRAAVTEN